MGFLLAGPSPRAVARARLPFSAWPAHLGEAARDLAKPQGLQRQQHPVQSGCPQHLPCVLGHPSCCRTWDKASSILPWHPVAQCQREGAVLPPLPVLWVLSEVTSRGGKLNVKVDGVSAENYIESCSFTSIWIILFWNRLKMQINGTRDAEAHFLYIHRDTWEIAVVYNVLHLLLTAAPEPCSQGSLGAGAPRSLLPWAWEFGGVSRVLRWILGNSLEKVKCWGKGNELCKTSAGCRLLRSCPLKNLEGMYLMWEGTSVDA